jgi:hypothetical protein
MDSMSDYERKLLRIEIESYKDLADSWKDVARRWKRAYFICFAGLVLTLISQLISLYLKA